MDEPVTVSVVYRGPAPGVVIAGGYCALRDVPVDVPEDLAHALLEQDTFEQPTKENE